ncbi:uncharacterized protein TNCV_2363351 [Trichonephila clavipes]|nr:uncharacterized protein TNCV_2363351 [Trichonephila clavipes]
MLESKEILSLAKFNLRGWPDKDTLSVNWEENSKINEIPVTKRKILSAVHRIFDPIGFTCPVTLEPKILLQECWKLGVSWDTELPLSISRKFERWKEHLKCLNNLEIPRCISKELSPNSDLSLHVFCDARLENVPIYCWSDSVNALYWIKRKENWGTFVNNRVQEIRRLTNPEDWKHIPGILNPADLPSRGCGVVELIASLWWEGPSWLNKPREEWPLSEACPDRATIDSEKERELLLLQSIMNQKKWIIFLKFHRLRR